MRRSPAYLKFVVKLFSHNSRLEELILSGNQLTSLQPYVLPPFTNLKVLLALNLIMDFIIIIISRSWISPTIS